MIIARAPWCRKGWIHGKEGLVRYALSPHFNERPKGVTVDMVVIHCISLPEGVYDNKYVDQLFLGCLDIQAHPSFESLKEAKVSAHIFIDRRGRIVQFVSFNDRAWHAGVSSFEGRENCNDYSIGIELEGTDQTTFTDSQYESLNFVLGLIQEYYPAVTRDRIVGHSAVAPGRKTDPGTGFDWSRIREKNPFF